MYMASDTRSAPSVSWARAGGHGQARPQARHLQDGRCQMCSERVDFNGMYRTRCLPAWFDGDR